jgi:GAF domain-containing protein
VESQLLHKARMLAEELERTTGKLGDLSTILQQIVQTVQKFFNTDHCTIFVMNTNINRLVASHTAVKDTLESSNEVFEQPESDWFLRRILEQSILVIEDMELMPEYHEIFTRSQGTHSFVGLALYIKHSQKQLGVLYLNFKQQQQFNAEDLELFRFLADQASFILQEAWLLQRYREVARIGQEINHDLATVETLFRKLQKHVASILDISCAFLLAIYQPQTNTVDLYSQENGNYIYHNDIPLQGAIKYAIEIQKTLFIRQASNEIKQLPFQIEKILGIEPRESFIFVPVVLRDTPLGILSIQHNEANAYNQDDVFILQLLANHVALSLHSMRLYSNLNRLNETGQILMQQLDSEQTLQATVDKIREVTKADVVILYPYLAAHQRFVLPPRISGTLLASSPESMFPGQQDDIAILMLHREKPIFAKQSATVYSELRISAHADEENFVRREQISSMAVVPLRVQDESVGTLFINFRQPQRLDASQKLFIEGLAHYAAIAIKNSQIFGSLSQRRVHELEILQYIDRELSRTLNLKSLLDTLLRVAHEQVPAEEAAILLYNPRTQALEVAAAIGHHAEVRQMQSIPLQEARGITSWVLEHKKPVRVVNVHRDLQWKDLYIQTANGMVSELDVPLLDGEEVVGVLNFGSTREGAFRQEDQDFLLTMAGQAVLAIKNAQAYEREKRLAEEGQVLNEISKEITSQLDPIHVFDLILEKALNLTRSTSGSLMLYDPDQNDLWIAAERGVADDKVDLRMSLHNGVEGYVATHKQLCNVADVSQAPWNEIYLEFVPATRSELAVPLLIGNDLRGVLNVGSSYINNFSESDERLLQGLADLAVVALQNAERYEQAKQEAKRFELLYQAGQELGKISELTQIEQTYDIILHIVEKYCDGPVVIRRYEEETQELVAIRSLNYQYSPPFPRIKLDEGINGQVARERRTNVIYDSARTPLSANPAKLSDPTVRSFVITPIMFNERYYGNLGLGYKEVGHFQDADVHFIEGLTQQLASTIYRLETAQERQRFEQRAISAETMSAIGQIAFELTHRWGNDLGLVRSYVNDIRSELKALNVTTPFITEKLENIVRAAGAVLNLSKELKQALVRTGEGITSEPSVIEVRVLLEEAQNTASLPSNIQVCLDVDDDVSVVRGIYSLVADILRNLINNAVDAMPEGGKITLRAYHAGRFVALEVIDTGGGILQENLSKIFDLFYSTKGSSGFGLWSARTNALRNQGELLVKSQEGQGSIFTLLLPRVEREYHEVLL